MVVSMAEFSRQKGVSKVAVTLAVKRGDLALNTDGKIDLDAPLTLAYSPRRKIHASAPKKPQGSTEDRQTDEGTTDEDSDLTWKDADAVPAGLLGIAKARAELRHRQRLGDLAELRLLQLKEVLIPKEMVVQKVLSMNDALTAHIHTVPAKLGPQLFALAKKGGATELEIVRALETALGGAVRSAVADITRLK